MRIKSIFAILLAIATMASCSDNNEGGGSTPDTGSSGTAYMSLNVTYPTSSTKATGSTEEGPVKDEAAIKDFYVLTFNAGKELIKHSNVSTYYTPIGTSLVNLLKVNPDTKYLLVIANPGSAMQERLTEISDAAIGGTTQTYTMLNAVLTAELAAGNTPDVLVNEIMGELDEEGIGKYFTMINVGTYDDVNSEWPEDGLLDVSENVITVDPNGTYKTDEAAQNAAKGKKATLKIERLAAKLKVDASTAKAVTDVYPNAKFEFGAWILDYRNSVFFPYAKKTALNTHNTSGGFYDNNFYTEDPNYILDMSGLKHQEGIILNKAANTDAVPADALWKATGGVDYCIENTMAKDAQKFGAATRLVIRGTYTPDSDAIPEGTDWFFWNTTAYSITSLKEYYNGLKAAGNPTTIEQLFIAATDKFLAEVQKKNAEIVDIDALTAERLAVIENGGEISKIDNCLRWYQKGLNYYYYEIRHDNSDLGQMEFGKYGVVRNNWYDLNLKNVNGKGTPWYPGGGPEEPDPGEDIDQESAYLYFEIEVGPWVYWTTDFDI